MVKTILSIKQLSAGYGKTTVVNDVSFSVTQGEILAIIGRNGVGKSTLIKSVIGEIDAESGEIKFNGRLINKLTAADRARLGLGYVPQGRGLFTNQTVLENLQLGKMIGNAPNSVNMDRAFKFFPILRERLKQRSGTLSGGQQQQLSIGRVLVGNPLLVLLDEPSEGIQPNIVEQIGEIIVKLRAQENLTVIIVEQNLKLIQACADRCLVIDKGSIVAEITPNELDKKEISKKYLAI